MRSPRLRQPLIAGSLASVMAVTAVGERPAVAADTSMVALPSDDQRASDGDLRPNGLPPTTPEVFDLDALVQAALERVDLFAGPEWDIDELAGALGNEPEAAFTFVRDHIGFDPYPGVLRGAHGTLVARAGNAWDRALLLQALLGAQGHEARLASATLDPDTIETILERALDGPAEPLADPDAADVLGLDVTTIATRARRDNAWLAEGLGARYGELGSGGMAGEAAVADHAWVQLLGDDGTVDLDPTLAGATPGQTLASADETLDAPPAEAHQLVRLGVIVESLGDAGLAEQRVLDVVLDAAGSVGDEIWLTFQADGEGLSGSIFEAMGEATWVPVLSVDQEDFEGTPFELGAGGDAGDFFFGGGAPELTALTIELAAEGAGLEPVTARRILLDRVTPSDRASGTFLSALLEPLPADGVVPALAGVHQVLVSNGAADLRTHAVNRAAALDWAGEYVIDPASAAELPLGDLFYPLAVANRSMVLASEHLLTDEIGVAGEARAFVGRPRAYLVTIAPYDAVADGSSITTDLALDGVEVVATQAAVTGLSARIRLWQGVLQQALETELALLRAAAVDPETLVVGSVSLDMDGVPSLVTAADLETIDRDRRALIGALEAGALALTVDGSPNGAFWAIDPESGHTSSFFEPGIRVGFDGGGNYSGSTFGAQERIVINSQGNNAGVMRNGKFYPKGRPPANRCQPGPDYLMLFGCVSVPASMATGLTVGAISAAIVAWATAIFRTLAALR